MNKNRECMGAAPVNLLDYSQRLHLPCLSTESLKSVEFVGRMRLKWYYDENRTFPI